MLPSLAEIVFECPHCEGPLIAWKSDAGQKTDCPHCFKPIEVPGSQVIDKSIFSEPSGLRRILLEVRDKEWEAMRRKLRAALDKVATLEEELRDARQELEVERRAKAVGTVGLPPLGERRGRRRSTGNGSASATHA